MTDNIYHEIQAALKDLEKRYNITILYAVESGSRVWGFNNPDSDYDVRFIFKYNDLNDYLTLTSKVDVLRYHTELLDFEGWDIRKALDLHYKDNPSLFEWLSPSIKLYYGVNDYRDLFSDLPEFNKCRLMHHYKSMALKTYDKYVAEKPVTDLKVLKKVCHVIRSILCFKVLYRNDEYPHLNIYDLLNQAGVDEMMQFNIKEVIRCYKEKVNIEEIEDRRAFQCTGYWISTHLYNMKNKYEIPKEKCSRYKDYEDYNTRFQDIVRGGY